MLLTVTKRAALATVLGIALVASPACGGRWQPVTTHAVASAHDEQATYGAVLEVAQTKGYTVLSKDDAAKTARLQAQSNAKSFIDVAVVPGQVKLSPAGSLVRGEKGHKVLQNELGNLECELKRRLGGASSVAASPGPATAPSSSPVAATGPVPQAWSEPAYDPSVWGNGNFTCLPVQ